MTAKKKTTTRKTTSRRGRKPAVKKTTAPEKEIKMENKEEKVLVEESGAWDDTPDTSTKAEQPEKPEFTFPNKIVTVKPVKRSGFTPTNHEANFLFKYAKNKIELPRLLKTGSFKDPFVSDEEREALEKALRINLNPYDEENSYFKKIRVVLGKEPLRLNLQDPSQYLHYVILRANAELVAKSWEDRNKKRTYIYAFVDEEAEEKDQLVKEDIASQAMETYNRLKKSPDDMRAVLISQKRNVAKHTKTNFILSQFFELYQELGFEKFLAATKDIETIRYKALIYDAKKARAISVTQMGAYILPDTPGAIAHSEGELISWLKDPNNSEEVAKIRYRAGYNQQ